MNKFSAYFRDLELSEMDKYICIYIKRSNRSKRLKVEGRNLLVKIDHSLARSGHQRLDVKNGAYNKI